MCVVGRGLTVFPDEASERRQAGDQIRQIECARKKASNTALHEMHDLGPGAGLVSES